MTKYEEVMHQLNTRKRMPIFPEEPEPNAEYIVALGGNLEVETLLEAYSKGYFPWTGVHPISWHSPEPRLLLIPTQFHASKSLRKLARKCKFTVRFDQNFRGVMEGCAYTQRKEQNGETWINEPLIDAYCKLHQLHIAHSIEVYEGDHLCGGLYGLTLGKAFFGESMFSKVPNTSKIALFALCQRLAKWQFDFIDCQQETGHLLSLGGVSVSRPEFFQLLHQALQSPSRHYSWAHPPLPTAQLAPHRPSNPTQDTTTK